MSGQNNASILALVSFAVGILVGAVMALFFAPMSGQQLRGRIGEEARVDWQRATDQMHQTQIDMRRAMENMRLQLEAYDQRTREQLSAQLAQLQAKLDAQESSEEPAEGSA